MERIVDDDIEITVNSGSVTKTFNHENIDVLVIKDKDGNFWYKGKDIAELLEYTNTRGALTRHVSKEYKKSFSEIGDRISTAKK